MAAKKMVMVRIEEKQRMAEMATAMIKPAMMAKR